MKKSKPTAHPAFAATSRTANAAPARQQTERERPDSERRDELARLLPLWPAEIGDLSLDGRRHIIAALERALRGERKRGKAGHWAYDLARHAALARNWKNECAALRAIDPRDLLRIPAGS